MGSRFPGGNGPVDVVALASLASNALVAAAVTDAWEGARSKIAVIFGRGRPDPQVEERYGETRAALLAASVAGAAGRCGRSMRRCGRRG